MDVPEPVSIALSSVSADTPVLVGRSDHYGLQVFRRADAIEIFPRMCPHEGACLDQKTLKGEKSLSCRWHGRRFGPVLKITLPAQAAEFSGAFHRFIVSGDELRIVPIPNEGKTTSADWTVAAVTLNRM
jgi:hypothetical protein